MEPSLLKLFNPFRLTDLGISIPFCYPRHD